MDQLMYNDKNHKSHEKDQPVNTQKADSVVNEIVQSVSDEKQRNQQHYGKHVCLSNIYRQFMARIP